MKLRSIAVAALLALTLAGCASAPETPSVQDELATSLGISGLSAEQAIDQLDATPLADRTQAAFASIRGDRLILMSADQKKQAELPITGDKFYLSIAPFVTETHDCFFHSLTTCVGELQDAAIDVTITDTASAKVLFEEQTDTFNNGFFGVWLPRNIEVEVEIRYEGMTATTLLQTTPDAPTCITTMQLK
ncbi:MAG: CueP family metal-binding protein [Microbacteriaceae bacterium]